MHHLLHANNAIQDHYYQQIRLAVHFNIQVLFAKLKIVKHVILTEDAQHVLMDIFYIKDMDLFLLLVRFVLIQVAKLVVYQHSQILQLIQ